MNRAAELRGRMLTGHGNSGKLEIEMWSIEDNRMSNARPAGIRRSIAMASMAVSAIVMGTADGRAETPTPRSPWTASRMTGTPEPPPPYTVEPAFPRLKFEFPVVMVPAQGTDRLFVGELHGRIRSFPNDPGCTKADLAFDVAKFHPDFTALYGLAFHPKFDENRYVYVCYVLKNDLPDGSLVSRFEVSRTDPPVIDPGEREGARPLLLGRP